MTNDKMNPTCLPVDFVDSARLDRLVVLLVPGQVSRRAGRREGARQREDDHPLALHDVVRRDVLPGEGIVAADRVIAHTALECHL